MDSQTQASLINHAMTRGYSQNEAETLVQQFIKVKEEKGYAVAYQKFIIRLLG